MSDASLQTLLEGALLQGRYRVLRRLSEGNFGAVFHARLELFGEPVRDVALKISKHTQLTREKAQEVFAEAIFQARVIDRLEDAEARRFFVPVHDLGLLAEHDNRGFVAMGLARGVGSTEDHVLPPDTLADEIARAPLGMPPATALALARQVCQAVAALHGLGVVHRDLKPDNILLTEHGRIRVIDFGLAAELDAAGVAHGAVGAHDHMAPETALVGRCDRRGDVYSLGVALYEMLTGRHPTASWSAPLELAEAERFRWFLARKRDTPIPPPSAANPAVPAWLDAVVADCLAFEPTGGRPADAGALLARLNPSAETFAGAAAGNALPPGDWRAWLDLPAETLAGADWNALAEALRRRADARPPGDAARFDALAKLAFCQIHLGQAAAALESLKLVEQALARGAFAPSFAERAAFYDGFARACGQRDNTRHWALGFKVKADQARRGVA